MRVTVEADLDFDQIERAVGEDVMDAIRDAKRNLESGRADDALRTLAYILGDKIKEDPEVKRSRHMDGLFFQWAQLPSGGRLPFWEWSHGKRKCA